MAKKVTYMTVHLYDADGVDHPEVNVKFFSSYEDAMAEVRDVRERRGADGEATDDDDCDEWFTEDGYIRIEEVSL